MFNWQKNPRAVLSWLGLLGLLVGGIFPAYRLQSEPRPTLSSPRGSTSTVFPSIEVMRFRSGLVMLVVPQPARPSFTATLHYRAGTAHEWQGLLGAAELASSLMLDGTSSVGTRNARLEAQLLRQLDQLDIPLQRKQKALELQPTELGPILTPEIRRLRQKQAQLQEKLRKNSLLNIYARLYEERGASAPTVRTLATGIQYSVTLPIDHLSFFMAMEHDRLLDGSSRNFYAARETLASKRQAEELLPANLALRGLMAQAFQVHPFERYLADSPSIRGISRQEFEFFKQAFLHPSNTVIAIVGGVRAADVRTLGNKYFQNLPYRAPAAPLEPSELPQEGVRRLEVACDGPAEVLMAFRRDAAKLRAGSPYIPILEELLGHPTHGVLTELVTQRVASQVDALEYPPADPIGPIYPSVFVVGAVGRPGVVSARLERTMKEVLTRLVNQGPTPEAFEAAKARALSRLAHLLATPHLLAPALANAYATLENENVLARLYESIKNADLGQTHDVIRSLFHNKNLSTAVLRPTLERKMSGDDSPKAKPAGKGSTTP